MESKTSPFGTPEWFEVWMKHNSVKTMEDLPKNPSVGDFKYVRSKNEVYVYGNEWVAISRYKDEKEWKKHE